MASGADFVQARLLFPRLWFDEEKCRLLLEALANYRAEFDERKGVLKDQPRHDWASHGADALRLLACDTRLGEDLPRTKVRGPSRGDFRAFEPLAHLRGGPR